MSIFVLKTNQMAKKKKISREHLVKWYVEYVNEYYKTPKSLQVFAQKYNFNEKLFYDYFKSFSALEQAVYKEFFDHTYDLLVSSEDYTSFDARNKLLSFYYTFFELLTANRTFVLQSLKGQKKLLKRIKTLKELRKVFARYIESLDIEKFTLNEKTLDNLQSKFIQEAAWLQFLFILKFWIDDTSSSFEKTDILIEKSINTSFDLINIQPLKSVLDLGKFLYNEKVKNQL